MKNVLYLIIFAFLFSCDDGDIIGASLDFDTATATQCGEYVFYTFNDNRTEALFIEINSTVDLTRRVGEFDYPSATVNRLVFDGDATNFFCNDVQPTEPQVVQTWEGSYSNLSINTTLEETDADGIPAEDEGQDPDGDGDFSDSLDTDGDGLYNYIDADDDGDNVLTSLEDANEDGDNNPFTNPTDTDGDGTPNYLDDDDDNDGILTRNEDIDGDLNPANDFETGNTVANYLDDSVMLENVVTENRAHPYTQSYTNEIQIFTLILSFEGGTTTFDSTYDFGTLNFTDSVTNGLED